MSSRLLKTGPPDNSYLTTGPLDNSSPKHLLIQLVPCVSLRPILVFWSYVLHALLGTSPGPTRGVISGKDSWGQLMSQGSVDELSYYLIMGRVDWDKLSGTNCQWASWRSASITLTVASISRQYRECPLKNRADNYETAEMYATMLGDATMTIRASRYLPIFVLASNVSCVKSVCHYWMNEYEWSIQIG